MKKINVGLVFGGQSAEHEISLRSAQNVIDAIDKEKYALSFIAIDKKGNWFTNTRLDGRIPEFPLKLEQFIDSISISMGDEPGLYVPAQGKKLSIDVFFPILHGPYGEDGTIQGLFRCLNIPFVGSDVLGSAVGMDKAVMKRLLVENGIPVGKYLWGFRDKLPGFEEVEQKLGMPVYIKPANMGSSVGINKVHDKKGFQQAVEDAFKYDRKIVIEENVEGLELECAILGNRSAKASAVGRIIAFHDFYTYASKYLDEKGAKLEIPAKISQEDAEKVRKISVEVFEALEAEGLARVDVFLKENGSVLVNEINTMPGFTSISMYPMLWKEMGVDYAELIDQLITLGLERHAERQKLSTTYIGDK